MDYIKREDAIRWVKTECNPYGKPTLDFESSKKVIAHLEQMPAADVIERKRGEWREKKNIINGYFSAYYTCSICDEIVPHTLFKMNFCPNCGADMREATDEN